MRVLAILPLYLAFFAPSHVVGQIKAAEPRKTVTIQDNHGKITIDETTYNNSYKDAILNLDKYIDTGKPITVEIGTNIINNFPFYLLKQGEELPVLGKFVASYPAADALSIMRIRLLKGHLLLSADVNGFDQKFVCRIKDNTLISAKDYHLYASDKYFELFDDYYIPVLQIELDKDKNQI